MRARLTRLPSDIAKWTGGASVAYRRVYFGAIEGKFPAVQSDTGQWSYDPADRDAILAGLGLTSSQAVAA